MHSCFQLNRITSEPNIAQYTIFNNAILANAESSQENNALKRKETVLLHVPNMTCSVCSITIKKELQATPGVQNVKVNFKEKIVIVTFDPNQIDVKIFIEIIAEARYGATLLST